MILLIFNKQIIFGIINDFLLIVKADVIIW